MNCKPFCNSQWVSPLLPLLHNTIIARGLTNSFVESKSCVALKLFFFSEHMNLKFGVLGANSCVKHWLGKLKRRVHP